VHGILAMAPYNLDPLAEPWMNAQVDCDHFPAWGTSRRGPCRSLFGSSEGGSNRECALAGASPPASLGQKKRCGYRKLGCTAEQPCEPCPELRDVRGAATPRAVQQILGRRKACREQVLDGPRLASLYHRMADRLQEVGGAACGAGQPA